MMKISRLTTIDNPNNYFDEPEEWEAWENATGMRATRMIGRFAYTSDQLSVEENEAEMERAIDDIIKHDPTGVFVKVSTTLDRVWA